MNSKNLTKSCQKDDDIPYIKKKYTKTCSHPIKLTPHPNIKSYALIMCDPDASVGVWYHWVVSYIPPNYTQLPENASQQDTKLGQGKNSWGNAYYQGPQPPKGQDHRYLFNVYGLSTRIDDDDLEDDHFTGDDLVNKIKQLQVQGQLVSHHIYCGRYTNQ